MGFELSDLSPGRLINKYVLGAKDIPGAPGTAGAPRANDRLVTDPATGFLYDPQNGQYYDPKSMDANGNPNPIVNPNVAQQVAGANALGQQFAGQIAGYDAREAQNYNRQNQLANQLMMAANGGGPNVAGAEFAVDAAQIGRNQMSQAAGLGGQNAVLARLAAQNNIGQMQSQGAQTAALNRLRQMQGAQQSLIGLGGQLGQQNMGMSGQKTSASLGEAGLAMQGESGREGLNTQAATANNTSLNSIAGGAANGGGAALTKYAMS